MVQGMAANVIKHALVIVKAAAKPVFVSLLLCLSAQPACCRQVRLSAAPHNSLAACQIEGMQEGAAWVDQHPR